MSIASLISPRRIRGRRCLSLVTTVLSLLLIVAPVSAAQHNVLLSRGRTEPVVAVDPGNPSVVVGAANTNYSAPVGDTYPNARFYSGDGGRSFAAGYMPVVRPFTTEADSSIAIARSGTVFYSFLGETSNYCSGGRSAVIVTHSIDHGRSFRLPVVVDVNPDDDKPYMGIENAKGRFAHLFVTWTRWHSHNSEIWYSRSTDGGGHFTRARMLYRSKQDNFGSVPIVGPHGHVYVFWSVFPDRPLRVVNHTHIVMRESGNDGRSFAPVRTVVAPFRTIPPMAQPGSLRSLTAPAVAVDAKGVIYLVYSAVTSDHGGSVVDADIRIKRSLNQGRTWSGATRVNDITRGDRLMPAVSVMSNGSVGIAFYDQRRSRNWLEVYAARVSYGNSVRVSRNIRVNQTYSSISDIFYIRPGSTCFSPGRFFGDYIGVAATDGNTLGVTWADTQLHVSQETDIWFAKVKLGRPTFSRRDSIFR